MLPRWKNKQIERVDHSLRQLLSTSKITQTNYMLSVSPKDISPKLSLVNCVTWKTSSTVVTPPKFQAQQVSGTKKKYPLIIRRYPRSLLRKPVVPFRPQTSTSQTMTSTSLTMCSSTVPKLTLLGSQHNHIPISSCGYKLSIASCYRSIYSILPGCNHFTPTETDANSKYTCSKSCNDRISTNISTDVIQVGMVGYYESSVILRNRSNSSSEVVSVNQVFSGTTPIRRTTPIRKTTPIRDGHIDTFRMRSTNHSAITVSKVKTPIILRKERKILQKKQYTSSNKILDSLVDKSSKNKTYSITNKSLNVESTRPNIIFSRIPPLSRRKQTFPVKSTDTRIKIYQPIQYKPLDLSSK